MVWFEQAIHRICSNQLCCAYCDYSTRLDHLHPNTALRDAVQGLYTTGPLQETVLDRADGTAPTLHHELDYADQESLCPPWQLDHKIYCCSGDRLHRVDRFSVRCVQCFAAGKARAVWMTFVYVGRPYSYAALDGVVYRPVRKCKNRLRSV